MYNKMAKKNIPSAAIIIIGNEILSGRTKDLNSSYLAQKLLHLGISINEIRVVRDDKSQIITTLNSLRKKYTYVFTSGGIGPTHDDITADCVAEAFGVTLPISEEAKKILASHYPRGENDLNEARLRMARIPTGASMIENSISKAPGFQIENVFVLAGVPKIFQVMVNFVLRKLDSADPIISKTIKIDKPEGEIAEKLEKVALEFPDVSIGSYPFKHNGKIGTNLVIMHRNMKIIRQVVSQISKI